MPDFGSTPYRVRSSDPNDLTQEINRVFGLLSDRLDKMEGLRGSPEIYDILTTNYDIVVTQTGRGLILKEDVNPPHYWRVTIIKGVLTATELGATYV